MTVKKALVVGCSLTSGFKMGDNPDDAEHNNPAHPRLWANKLLSQLDNFEITNRSRAGANNQWIFMEAMSALAQDYFDVVLVQWTYLGRINLPVGLELYKTYTMLQGEADINLVNHVTMSAKWLQDLGYRLRSFKNLHWDILDIVRYVNILTQFQKLKNSKVYFVNGVLQWSPGYFEKKSITVPSDLSNFEQHLLEAKHREDSEVFAIYDMMHQQYQQHGTIQSRHWLNLYDPMKSWQVDDIVPDDYHPGYTSQDVFVAQLLPTLIKYYRE
jgi:hypothetical protein